MDKQIYELSREAHREDCSRESYIQYYQALEAKIAWMQQEAYAASATIERLREALQAIHKHQKRMPTIDVTIWELTRAALGEEE